MKILLAVDRSKYALKALDSLLEKNLTQPESNSSRAFLSGGSRTIAAHALRYGCDLICVGTARVCALAGELRTLRS